MKDLKIELVSDFKNPEVKVVIYPNLGGLCASIKLQGRELLAWSSPLDPNNYYKISGGLPLLFPICGRLSRQGQLGQYLYNGQIWSMGIHGFLHALSAEIIHQDFNQVRLRITHNDWTLGQYPFEFEIILDFQLTPPSFNDNSLYFLTIRQTYKNLSEKIMPISAGFHPYFSLPLGAPREKIFLEFNAIQSFKYNTALTEVIGGQKCLDMPVCIADFLKYNERLSLLDSRPGQKRVKLNFPDNFSLVQEAGEGFDYLQIYTDDAKNFICLEPWMSHPNSFNTLLSTRLIAPKEVWENKYQLGAKG